MKICFPTTVNQGLQSTVFEHFGSAPMFLLVDAENGTIIEQVNRDLGHAHGRCQPLRALAGQAVDAIVVGGIGKGALTGLNQSGLKVFQAQTGTIADNLDSIKAGKLSELTPAQVCGGHAGGHGHGHAHGAGHGCGC